MLGMHRKRDRRTIVAAKLLTLPQHTSLTAVTLLQERHSWTQIQVLQRRHLFSHPVQMAGHVHAQRKMLRDHCQRLRAIATGSWLLQCWQCSCSATLLHKHSAFLLGACSNWWNSCTLRRSV
jgi:hypothetical protein